MELTLGNSLIPVTGVVLLLRSMLEGNYLAALPYMPPEQLRGEPVHPMWDLWALGVLSIEMLTGARRRGSQSGGLHPLLNRRYR